MTTSSIIPEALAKLAISSSLRGDHDLNEEWLPAKILAKRWGCSKQHITRTAKKEGIESRKNGRESLFPVHAIRTAMVACGKRKR